MVNGDSMMDLFEQTKVFYADKKKINLVLDAAGYHRSQVVKDKANVLGIILHYLTPYSPNLNPIERLWKVMNEKVRNNRYFATAKEFRRNIDNFFDITLPNIGANLNGRINDNFQRFNQVYSS
jgi:transposase